MNMKEAHEKAVAEAAQECHFKRHAERVVTRYLSEMLSAGFAMQSAPENKSNSAATRTFVEYIRSRWG